METERDYTFRRGDICWYTDPACREDGSFILGGTRSVVIVSNDRCNETSGTVLVAPTVTNTQKKVYPSQVVINVNGRERRIKCEQIRVAEKTALQAPVMTLDDEAMEAVDQAIARTFGLDYLLPEPEPVMKTVGLVKKY